MESTARSFNQIEGENADDVSEIDLELMQAMTHQATLAIQLTRLADESKLVALAQELERGAEERAAEFANANEVLRSTLDQLAAEHDLHSFPASTPLGAITFGASVVDAGRRKIFLTFGRVY